MSKEYEPIYAYMCKVDYDYHLDGDIHGTVLYPDLESLKKDRECVEQCGIVKVKVEFEELVQPEDRSWIKRAMEKRKEKKEKDEQN